MPVDSRAPDTIVPKDSAAPFFHDKPMLLKVAFEQMQDKQVAEIDRLLDALDKIPLTDPQGVRITLRELCEYSWPRPPHAIRRPQSHLTSAMSDARYTPAARPSSRRQSPRSRRRPGSPIKCCRT
jgi:hypothetical protein